MNKCVQKQLELIDYSLTRSSVQGARAISYHRKVYCWSFPRERHSLCAESESPTEEGGDEQRTQHPRCSCILQEDERVIQEEKAGSMVPPCPRD